MTEGVMEEERGGEKRRVKLGVKGKRSREWGREGGEGRSKREGGGERGIGGEKGRGGAKERVWEWEEEEEKRR